MVAAVSALGARAHLDEDMGLGELQQACELAIRLGTVPGMDRALNKWYEQHLDPAKGRPFGHHGRVRPRGWRCVVSGRPLTVGGLHLWAVEVIEPC